MNGDEKRRRVAVISGGSAGIGMASAIGLATAGYDLVIGGRSQSRLEDALTTVRSHAPNVSVIGVSVDLTKEEDAARLVHTGIDQRGFVDVLVNSVGGAPGGSFDSITAQQWREAFELKVLGSVSAMRVAAEAMVSEGFGRIVNIAGTAGKEPDPGMACAAAINGALIAVTKAAAIQLADQGITVNTVNPGPTSTSRWDALVSNYARKEGVSQEQAADTLASRIPRGRTATPKEVAALVTFLASEAAGHITGATIPVDGGQSRSI